MIVINVFCFHLKYAHDFYRNNVLIPHVSQWQEVFVTVCLTVAVILHCNTTLYKNSTLQTWHHICTYSLIMNSMKEYENIVNVLSGTFCMNSTKNNLSITEDRREKNVLHKLLVCILNAGKKNLTST